MRAIPAFRSISILISSISIFCLSSPKEAQAQAENESISLRRRVVERVDIFGVSSFDPSDIKKLLFTKPNRWYNVFKKRELSKSNINLDEGIIRRFYGRRGFLFAEVHSIIGRAPDNKAVVTFTVNEGRRVNLAGAWLEGGLEEINRRFGRYLNDFDIGQPVDAEEVTSSGYRLRDLYFDNGYPYAKIYSRYEFSADSSAAAVTYAIAESVLTVFGETNIPPDVYTDPFVVERELLNKPGRLYRQRDITESEQRLYSLGLFRLASLRREDTTAVIANDTGRVDFSLSLRERKSYFMNFGFGLGREDDFPLVQRNTALWGNRNIFGTGRKVILSVRPQFQIGDASGGLEAFNLSNLRRDLRFSFVRSTIELDYITPWMFRWRIPVTAKVFYEPYTLKPSISGDDPYRYDRIAGEVIFGREFDQFTIGRITANTEYIDIRDVPPEQEDIYREKGDNQIRRRILLYGERDTRDNILMPQKGSFSYAGVDFVGGPLGGDFSYVRTQFMWSRFNRVRGQNVLASRIWLGFLDDRFEGGRSATDDRFSIGGANTIRGFREKSVGPAAPQPAGGRYMMLGNIELRRPLFWRFGGATFLDVGNSYARVEEVTPISINFSSGLGLQFFTPIGPVRLDYAVPFKKEFDLGAGLYHFAILYAF